MRIRIFLEKIEFRVMLIILGTTAVVAISVLAIVYNLSYQTMVKNIEARSKNIYSFVMQSLSQNHFTELNDSSDELKTFYISSQKNLNQIKEIGGLAYLYTAKKEEDAFIYIIDGTLKYRQDFRHIGDTINSAYQRELNSVYQGKIVQTTSREDSSGKNNFLIFWPVFDGDENVIGIVGMEFDISSQDEAFSEILLYSSLLLILIMIFAAIISSRALKKLSDPFFKKLAYTDYMTGLKNRTAFELDIKRINQDLKNDSLVSIIVFDLDNLKYMNDTLGHSHGDLYIKKAGDLFVSELRPFGDVYRTGGDEFAAILKGFSMETVISAIEHINVRASNDGIFEDGSIKFSYGIAEYDQTCDKGIHDTYDRADKRMYQMKALSKETTEQHNREVRDDG